MVRLCNAQSNNMIDLKFITTFNNISTISQQLVLMVDYVGELVEIRNLWPWKGNSQTLPPILYGTKLHAKSNGIGER